MSWDVILMSRAPTSSATDRPPPLGGAAEVRAKISDAIPDVDWSNTAWGILDRADFSIEFSHQAEGPSETVMLHVRGRGDPVSAILKLCKKTSWVAFDTTTGEFMKPGKRATAGWEKFQRYVRKNEKA